MGSRDVLPVPDRQRVELTTYDQGSRYAEFAYDGGGLRKGRKAELYLDGDKVCEGRVDATVPIVFSADETTDIGSDSGTSVSDDLDVRESRFTPRVRWVEIDLGDDAQDADHLITDEERLSIAMARQ